MKSVDAEVNMGQTNDRGKLGNWEGWRRLEEVGRVGRKLGRLEES